MRDSARMTSFVQQSLPGLAHSFASAPVLGQISGENVLWAVIWVIVIGVCFYLLNWLIDYVGLPMPFSKVAKVILAIAAVVLLINLLMGLGGHSFIRW